VLGFFDILILGAITQELDIGLNRLLRVNMCL